MGPGDYTWTANLNAANLAPPEVVSRLSMASMQNRAASDNHSGMSLKLLTCDSNMSWIVRHLLTRGCMLCHLAVGCNRTDVQIVVLL